MSLFSKPKAAAPIPVAQPAPPPPTVDTAADAAKVAQDNQDAQDELNRRRGRAATVLTSQKGDTSEPTLGASTALGL